MKNDYSGLIVRASKCLAPRENPSGRLIGDVASLVVDDKGREFSGVCIDTPVWGICAERSAISAAVTAGSQSISTMVAVWRDPQTGLLHVLPPCGGCRQFALDLDPVNRDCRVVLGPADSASLGDLVPKSDWPEPLDEAF